MKNGFEKSLCFLRQRYATEPFMALIAVLYAVFVLIYFFMPVLTSGEQPLTDYISFWVGGMEMNAGLPGNIFNEPLFKEKQVEELGRYFEGILPWVISPSFMLYAAPLAKLPYIVSILTFNVLSLIIYAASLWYLFPRRKVLLAMLCMPSVLFCLYHGQTGLMSAALIAGCLFFYERKPLLAGLVLGLLIYKPQIGILFPVAFLAARQWKTIMGAAVTAVSSILLSIFFFGWTIWDLYLFHNAKTFEHLIETQHSFARIQTVFGLVRVITGSSSIAMIAQAICAVIVAIIVFMVWRNKLPFELKALVLVIGICFSTPYLQLYDLTILSIAFVLFFRWGNINGFIEGDKEWLTCVGLILFFGVFLPVGVLCSLIMGWRVSLHIRQYMLQNIE